MIRLSIHHRTVYRYGRPVSFGPHRLMLRPRESRDLRLISSHVTVAPAAIVTWAQDVFGNAVATAAFQTMADSLAIDSVAELELEAGAVAECVEIRWRVSGPHDAIRSSSKVNDLIGRLFGEALPAVDLPHDDLA